MIFVYAMLALYVLLAALFTVYILFCYVCKILHLDFPIELVENAMDRADDRKERRKIAKSERKAKKKARKLHTKQYHGAGKYSAMNTMEIRKA